MNALRKIPVTGVAVGAAAITTVVAASLHLVFASHAGALWRDEVNTLEIATMATFSELWTHLTFDSFPAFFFLVLRLIAGAAAETSDSLLRVVGAAVGLLILGAVWWNARMFRIGLPLVSLALIGLNPMIIRYGDSVRAYGLGMLLMLVCIGAMWRLSRCVTWSNTLFAAVAAVLSVQTLYHNAFLLLSLSAAAAAVTLRRRRFKALLVIFGIGLSAALSMLVYLPTVRRVSSTSFFWKSDFTLAALWRKLSETLGSPMPEAAWIWVLLFASAVLAGVWALSRRATENDESDRDDRLLFSVVALAVGTVAYFAFLLQLSYTTQPWYYIVFAAFAATCIDVALASLSAKPWLLAARSGFAVAFVALCAFPAWQALEVRQTNVDSVAAQLEQIARPEDLILINTWNYGIPFRRYYHGSAKYMTIPPIEDLRCHRMDVLKHQMMSSRPIAPALTAIEETLRSGHTVWLVGWLSFVPPGGLPLEVAPARESAAGWKGGAFYRAWAEQTGHALQKSGATRVPMQVPASGPAMHYEDLQLTAFYLPKAEGTRPSLSHRDDLVTGP